MNTNNLDMEQLRKAWVEMGKALGMETPPSDPDKMNNMKTNLDKLRIRYSKGWEFSLIGGIALTIFTFLDPLINTKYRITLSITYLVLMLSNAYVLYRLWRGLEKIDPLSMSITHVCSMAKYYKKYHILYNIIFFPLAIVWCGYFMFAIYGVEFGSINSTLIGCIIGGISGLYGLWLYLRDYRNLTK